MSFQTDAQKYGVGTSKTLECWENLCDKDDRSSPEEYPDHCLITYDELADYMNQMRETIIDECAKAMDEPRIAIELAEIHRAKDGGVLYNPEQTIWLKAAAIIRTLKAN